MHPFSTPWKNQKTVWFSDAFRVQKKDALRTNGLIYFKPIFPFIPILFFFFLQYCSIKVFAADHWEALKYTLWKMFVFRVFLVRIFIRSEYGKTRTIQSMWENMDRKNSECEHFSRSDKWEHWHEMG